MSAVKGVDQLVNKAEQKIQSIVLRLDEELSETNARIDGVTVDTRQWASMRVSIILRDAP